MVCIREVRSALNGMVAPFFTHQVAWRALIPATPGDPAEAEVHMGAGRHLVSYPLRGGDDAQYRGSRRTASMGRRRLEPAR